LFIAYWIDYIPILFYKAAFLVLRKNRNNTRLMFENQEKLNKKLIAKIKKDEQKKTY